MTAVRCSQSQPQRQHSTATAATFARRLSRTAVAPIVPPRRRAVFASAAPVAQCGRQPWLRLAAVARSRLEICYGVTAVAAVAANDAPCPKHPSDVTASCGAAVGGRGKCPRWQMAAVADGRGGRRPPSTRRHAIDWSDHQERSSRRAPGGTAAHWGVPAATHQGRSGSVRGLRRHATCDPSHATPHMRLATWPM